MRWLALVLVLCAGAGTAQDFTALARLDAPRSSVTDRGDGIALDLALSQPVPWRIFTLDDPARLVLDFREVDWQGVDPAALLASQRAHGLRAGRFAPGWSRMVLDLSGPYVVESAEMDTGADEGTGSGATVRVRLSPATPEAFAAAAGAPEGAAWPDPPPTAPVPDFAPGLLVVVIDPGHGGIDPGAQSAGLREADLVLDVGLELAEAVARAGMVPVLTRADDRFVPLQVRMSIAREAGADLFLSIHADALTGEQATGASVYTLSGAEADEANARLAERHGRGDLLAGVDLAGQDDGVAEVLMDLARLETGPAGVRLADALVAGLRDSGAVVNGRPRREAPLAVLEAPDFPSVLIELGFLSNDSDRARMTSAEGRAPLIDGILLGIEAWALDDAARAPLQRR